jgi:flagellar biosynthesis protein FlhG
MNEGIRNLLGGARQAEGKPLLASFLSGKGGVGKSIIAYNLAVLSAEAERRTLIIDCDWHFGNQHILANARPEYTLADIISAAVPVGRAIMPIWKNLDLIASPSAGDAEVEFSPRDYAAFLSRARESFASYQYIFIDAPSNLVELIALAANACDVNMIVLVPELTSISDAYGLYKYLIRKNRRIAAQLLINRVQNAAEAEYIYGKLSVLTERFLRKVPFYAGYLLEDKRLMESASLQKPLIKIDQNSPALEGFLHISERLIGTEDAGGLSQEKVGKETINHSRILADTKE